MSENRHVGGKHRIGKTHHDHHNRLSITRTSKTITTVASKQERGNDLVLLRQSLLLFFHRLLHTLLLLLHALLLLLDALLLLLDLLVNIVGWTVM